MMGFIWFWLVAIMIVGYIVLDGFDLGVGVLHLFLVRTEAERQATLRSIGPVWDGNEVWLLAGGGTLYFAFPLLYASAFSGFYLPLMIVLWLLILRGVSLELRNHIDVGVWRDLLDGVFGVSSTLLIIFFGAALANVLRGVPLQADGYFFLPLWTNWQPGPHPGILDWYTVIGGVLALAALTLHGSLWLVMKVSGDLEHRARRLVPALCLVVSLLTLVSLWATMAVRPSSIPRCHLVLQSRSPAPQSIPRFLFLPVLPARGRMLGALPHAASRHHGAGPRHHSG
jgi:cytochrome d ubiquinol oxidase subunit II